MIANDIELLSIGRAAVLVPSLMIKKKDIKDKYLKK